MSGRKSREEVRPGGRYDISLDRVVVKAPGLKPDEAAEKMEIVQKVLSDLPPEVDRGLRMIFGIPAPPNLPLSRKGGATPAAQAEIDQIECRALEHLQIQQVVDSLK